MLVAAWYAVGYYILNEQQKHYAAEIAQYEPQKSQYSETVKQADSFTKDLVVAKSILSNEVTFSNLLIDIAKTLPKNVVLANISVRAADLNKPIELSLYVVSPLDAVAAKVAFEKSAYFTDTQLRVIQLSSDMGAASGYSFNATILTTINQAKYAELYKRSQPWKRVQYNSTHN